MTGLAIFERALLALCAASTVALAGVVWAHREKPSPVEGPLLT